MTDLPPITRQMLTEALGKNPRTITAFEQFIAALADAGEAASGAATTISAIQGASILTLGPNATLTNERVLTAGAGLSATDDGTRLTLSSTGPAIDGGFPVTFIVTTETNLILPPIGTVATLADIAGAVSGLGTVSSVSVVTANGVSGSVANPTTTPAITLTLGAITPSSVNASGTIAGTNITAGGNTIGNSATATKLATPRTIGISGDATWSSGAFDGSANVSAALTLATVNANVGAFGSATQVGTFTVNAKGLITAAANVTITPAAGSITGGQALTRVDDTNVTLTLGGTPATALLQATSLTLGWTGQLGVARGGTNIASYAVGDLLYASGATTLAKLADVATGNALISGGVTTAPLWGKIGLTTHVSGTLPVGNGGTGGSAASGTLLDNITGFASTGVLARTAGGTYAFRTITGTANEITLVDGNGVAGNPIVSLPATITMTGKVITGGTYNGIGTGGVTNAAGAAGSTTWITANISAATVAANNITGFQLSELGTVGAQLSIVRDGSSAQVRLTTINSFGPMVFGSNATDVCKVVTTGFEPFTDDTFYLGRNSAATPKAWKGLILRDTASGTYYRLQITSGTVQIVSL